MRVSVDVTPRPFALVVRRDGRRLLGPVTVRAWTGSAPIVMGVPTERHGAPLSLGATTLLHQAYIDMAERDGPSFPDRARFMGYAARVMRGREQAGDAERQ